MKSGAKRLRQDAWIFLPQPPAPDRMLFCFGPTRRRLVGPQGSVRPKPWQPLVLPRAVAFPFRNRDPARFAYCVDAGAFSSPNLGCCKVDQRGCCLDAKQKWGAPSVSAPSLRQQEKAAYHRSLQGETAQSKARQIQPRRLLLDSNQKRDCGTAAAMEERESRNDASGATRLQFESANAVVRVKRADASQSPISLLKIPIS